MCYNFLYRGDIMFVKGDFVRMSDFNCHCGSDRAYVSSFDDDCNPILRCYDCDEFIGCLSDVEIEIQTNVCYEDDLIV